MKEAQVVHELVVHQALGVAAARESVRRSARARGAVRKNAPHEAGPRNARKAPSCAPALHERGARLQRHGVHPPQRALPAQVAREGEEPRAARRRRQRNRHHRVLRAHAVASALRPRAQCAGAQSRGAPSAAYSALTRRRVKRAISALGSGAPKPKAAAMTMPAASARLRRARPAGCGMPGEAAGGVASTSERLPAAGEAGSGAQLTQLGATYTRSSSGSAEARSGRAVREDAARPLRRALAAPGGRSCRPSVARAGTGMV